MNLRCRIVALGPVSDSPEQAEKWLAAAKEVLARGEEFSFTTEPPSPKVVEAVNNLSTEHGQLLPQTGTRIATFHRQPFTWTTIVEDVSGFYPVMAGRHTYDSY